VAPPRRIPTKAELLRLQRQFKTDARIAERLGNVAPYLVSYWRRKRNVPNYSAPKFAEKEISVLWERFGDDDRCGTELGVSKAAFYSWRRRYGIKSKPVFLKLEQMEINFPGDSSPRSISNNQGIRPATHKLIFSKNSGRNTPDATTFSVMPDLIAINNPTADAIASYLEKNKKPVAPIDKLAFMIQGYKRSLPESGSTNNSSGCDTVHQWVRKMQIRHVYSPVDGNMWNGLCCSGKALPGQLVLCQRGFERFAGAIGSLGWWSADEDLVTAIETGKIIIESPEVVRVNISGKRYAPICATDILINLAANLAEKDYSGTALEYAGASLVSMPIADRQALCAIGSLIDVRSALIPCDAVTLRHTATLGNWTFDQVSPDRDAEFVDSYQFNIESVKPMVAIKRAGNGTSEYLQQSQLPLSRLPIVSSQPEKRSDANQQQITFQTAHEVTGLQVDVVFIGGVPGGDYESLRKAAEALHGEKVADHVRLLVSPVSQQVYLRCLKRGILRQLLEAGAVILNPGVDSPSLGALGISPAAKVATTSVEPLFFATECTADNYIVSPLTAAVSAARGHLLDSRGN
jgi:3-isopropylmalate/(R)-2-methylmalate dehydratase large subunit